MSIKKILPIILIVSVLAISVFFLLNKQKPEDIVFEKTVEISKQYIALRYRTDDVLINAKYYESYDDWNEEMTSIIQEWEALESSALKLEENADKMAEEEVTSLIPQVSAYDKQEISDVFDKAPAGKKIATLAKYLGVDAKRAYSILVQDQNQVTADAWNKAGDTFQKLETSAVVIKDGCKVAGFVGGVILTGGVAGVATAGTLTTTTVVVAGVDLALEVTEDGAKIAMGDKNKISSFVKDVRTVTEPVANILTITNIPSNLGNAFGKFDAVMIGLEQLRESAQEGKVIGVDLTDFEHQGSFQVIKKTQYPGTVTVAEMEKAEIEEWLKSLNKEYIPMTQEEVEDFVKEVFKETEKKEEIVEEESVKEKEKDTTTENKETTKKGVISFDEWDGWGDEDSRYKEDLVERFGNPDVTHAKGGTEMWVYYDLVYYTSGATCSPMYTFYDTDQTATRKCETPENVESILNYY